LNLSYPHKRGQSMLVELQGLEMCLLGGKGRGRKGGGRKPSYFLCLVRLKRKVVEGGFWWDPRFSTQAHLFFLPQIEMKIQLKTLWPNLGRVVLLVGLTFYIPPTFLSYFSLTKHTLNFIQLQCLHLKINK
jgi:hypothetical protein